MPQCRDRRPLFRGAVAAWMPHRRARLAPIVRRPSILLTVALVCALTACATPQPRPRADSAAARCIALFEQADAAVARESVGDAMAARIRGLPYLRADRLLASFRDEIGEQDAQRFWIGRLATLDEEARAAEFSNLSGSARAALARDARGGNADTHAAGDRPQPAAPGGHKLTAALDRCRDVLVEADLAEADRAARDRLGIDALQARSAKPRLTGATGSEAESDEAKLRNAAPLPVPPDARPTRFDSLRAAATVPDDYSLVRRVLGLYPLTRIPFAAGVRAFERNVESTFALPLELLPRRGRLLRFAPAPAPLPDRPLIATMLRSASANPLHAPYPDAPTLRRLAAAYAPVFEIDVATDDDRLGRPRWPASGPAAVDTAEPAVFFRAARTRVADRVLLQLVYTAWFPARPREGRFDLLGGHLDALVWRVTLAPDGEPVLFDSIHGCGCYHFFFPTPRAEPRPAPSTLDEWRFVPQRVARQAPGEHVVLRVAAGTHYLERVRYEKASSPAAEPDRDDKASFPTGDAIRYSLVPDDDLRSLPRIDGSRRSLYGPDGFVAGSERAERFVFWPMGIANPGAMRQWGRHATAFVGRRHFDDARLVDERFLISE
ncbi:MAG: hypothetical protein ROZ37_06705 [Aromatoleum sp.]|uniref:hypothetical protein n=1 Tax=Aromatoleum sp. TaxID=2307007 RepID=UPI002895CF17|nr:hypothetical protein [Aromatoleum sp.]MDT3670006.1 hypothetical protein [Aromatoleum sp.]